MSSCLKRHRPTNLKSSRKLSKKSQLRGKRHRWGDKWWLLWLHHMSSEDNWFCNQAPISQHLSCRGRPGHPNVFPALCLLTVGVYTPRSQTVKPHITTCAARLNVRQQFSNCLLHPPEHSHGTTSRIRHSAFITPHHTFLSLSSPPDEEGMLLEVVEAAALRSREPPGTRGGGAPAEVWRHIKSASSFSRCAWREVGLRGV